MTQEHLAIDLINWGVNVSFIVPFLFPLYIRLIWAWEKDEWGWNIVLLDLALSIAILPTFIHRVFGVMVYTLLFLWMEATSLWLIPSIVIWRSILIWIRQRRGS